jgi:hypothetical protein
MRNNNKINGFYSFILLIFYILGYLFQDDYSFNKKV